MSSSAVTMKSGRRESDTVRGLGASVGLAGATVKDEEDEDEDEVVAAAAVMGSKASVLGLVGGSNSPHASW